VLFEEWSADIQEQYKEELDVLGREISAYFREEPRACLRISGHTDRRGPLERNLAISKKRAKSVKDYLVNHFAIEPERILAEGCGPWKPMSPRDDPVGWQLNRRVEFTRVQ
jgi:OOP family OmpA-OmpF porin